MNPIVKKDILNVLHEAVVIIKAGEIMKLRELSDHVIHNASIFQDKDSITIAVTIHALSKLYRFPEEVDKFVLPRIENSARYLEDGDINKYESEIRNIIKDLSEKDEKAKFYIQEVFELAQIKKASKMFEHGISLGQVAEALGIYIWDITEYVGKTRIVDQFEYKSSAIKKLAFSRQLFNAKTAKPGAIKK
jgi:hypothetical protein